MDLMLPMKSGEEILRELRAKKDTSVIVLSAKNAVYNRIELLRLGADDFICKPFDIDEVICEEILANYLSFESRGITPAFEQADDTIWVWADKKLLTRVIQNIHNTFTTKNSNFTTKNRYPFSFVLHCKHKRKGISIMKAQVWKEFSLTLEPNMR